MIEKLINEFGDVNYITETDLERAILILRENGKYNYRGIQLRLGNPSKKFIREVLLKYNKDLIELDCNYNKLKKQY